MIYDIDAGYTKVRKSLNMKFMEREMNKDIVRKEDKDLILKEKQLFERALRNVREDMWDNTYILEAVKVLSVRGYRSAIGSYWNAVIDDLRKKNYAQKS